MQLKEIKPSNLKAPADIFLKRWFALTAGDETNYNAMTIGWGSIGGMWSMPFVQVAVRPSRHTYQYMEKYNTFTISSFPEENKADLKILGTKSGRDGDKIAKTKLTTIKSEIIEAPGFKEADLIIECKKIYWQDMNPDNFLSDKIMKNYPCIDIHI